MVNYKGRQFMQGILDNSVLWKSLVAAEANLVICDAEVWRELNAFLGLVPWP